MPHDFRQVNVCSDPCPLCISNCSKDKTTSTQPPNLDPLAYYALNGNVNDSIGNHNGHMIGNGAFVSDRFDNPNSALQLNGTAQYVYLPQDINITNDLSLSFWIETDTSVSRGWPYGMFIIDRDVCTFSVRDWSVTMGLGGKLIFNSGAGSADSVLISDQDINDGNWKHIVVIRDRLSRLKRIYINGHLDASSGFDSQSFTNNDQDIFLAPAPVIRRITPFLTENWTM